MNQNLGKTDRIIRTILGLGFLSFLALVDGNIRWIGLLGIPLLVSALLGICCLYYPFGINTKCCSKEDPPTSAHAAPCCKKNASTETKETL